MTAPAPTATPAVLTDLGSGVGPPSHRDPAAPAASGGPADHANAEVPDTDEVELVLNLQLVLGRLVRRLRRSSGGQAGVSGTSALAALTAADAGVAGNGMRLSDLAAVENVSAPTVTRIVDHLVDQGLVRRVPNPADGRSSLIEVTGAGQDVLAAVRDERGRRLLDRVQHLDPASVTALRAALPALALLADDDTPPPAIG